MGDVFERLFCVHPELRYIRRGLPYPGQRPDKLDFFPDVKVIDDAFVNSNIMYSYEQLVDKKLTLFNAGAGSPMNIEPYPIASQVLQEIVYSPELSQYQLAAGDLECREHIAEALKHEGFCIDNGLSSANIIFTHSTTEAFDFIVKLLLRPYDVIIFSGPTYGLFTYVPERNNAISRILPLDEKDNWLVNPTKLEDMIVSTNKDLKELKEKLNLDYQPCVAAYFNINPSNPTGKVMTHEHIPILEELYKVCVKNEMWIIDDIIYKELVFDENRKAVAMSTVMGDSKNIITILGPSKTFGFAGARAGMIIADEVVIRGIRPIIFQHMDSTSLFTGKLLDACYGQRNPDTKKEYQAYFSKIRCDYLRKYNLMRMLIEGKDAVDSTVYEQFHDQIYHKYPDEAEDIMEPVDDIKIAGNIYPESGFFLLLDFTASKGKKYREVTIESERDILYFYYVYAYVKLLMGKSIGWPRRDEFVARVSYALEDNEIILMMKQMKDASRLLK